MAASRPLAESPRRDASLGAALRRSADRILQQWTSTFLSDGSQVGPEPSRVLGGDPWHVLDAIIGRVESGKLDRTGGKATSSDGAAAASTEEPPPDRLLQAYGLLRQAILEQAARELGTLKADQITLLCGAIEAEMAPRLASLAEKQISGLRAVAEAQGKYMSYLSHDLRGSLNGAVLMLEVLKRELQDHPELSESVADLNLVRRSIMDTVTVMERHLFADRLRRRKIEPMRRTVDIKQITDEVKAQYAEAARAKGDLLQIEVPDNAVVEGDASLLSSALQALVDNAIKHGTRGTIRISATTGGDGHADTWTLAVEDQGPGLAPDRLAQLMDPIRRMDMKDRGLGLTIAQYAVQLSGGRLEASSQPGQGSTFRLVLPAAGR